MGGGTILAARHRHRSSTDIDFKSPKKMTPVSMLHDAEYADFRKALRTAGWIVLPTASADFFTAHRRNASTEDQNQRLELWTNDSKLTARSTALIDGRIETVQSDGEIIAGKTERFGRCVARDVFDVTVLAETNPTELERGINVYNPRKVGGVADLWTADDAGLSRRAAKMLKDIPPEHAAKLRNLGIGGAGVLAATAYSLVRVEIDGGRAVLTTESKLCGRRTEDCPPDELDEMLTRTGIAARFREIGGAEDALREARAALEREGTNGVLIEERGRGTFSAGTMARGASRARRRGRRRIGPVRASELP